MNPWPAACLATNAVGEMCRVPRKDQLRDGGSGGCGGKWRGGGLGEDTGSEVAPVEAHFTDKETKTQLGNTRSGLTFLQNSSCFFWRH